MGIKLITKTEKLTATIMGCDFYYRRIPVDVKQRIIKENTRRGVTDNEGVMADGFSYSITGWGGDVPTIDGEPAEFNQENLAALPDRVKARLTACIFGSVDGEMVDDLDPLEI